MELLKTIALWFVCGLAFAGGVLVLLALLDVARGALGKSTKGETTERMLRNNERIESHISKYAANTGRIADVLEWWKERHGG